ncbi:MAG TPA: hypothetical protein PKH16_00090 [Aequorivita sp.]|nr:hypothetical protein [Aequorivita sp.]
MPHDLPKHIKLPPKALAELKEALYQEIGMYAKDYTEAELHRLGSFVLKVVVLSSRIRLKKLREQRLEDKTFKS